MRTFLALALLVAVAACGPEKPPQTGPAEIIARGFKIGLMLPDLTTPRWEKFDRPYITSSVAQLCPNCEIVSVNAEGDPVAQRRQLDQFTAQGIKTVILTPVDARGIQPSVDRAAARAVRIVSYDRLAEGAIDAYTSFDNVEVGRLQGQALVDAIRARGHEGQIIMLNGPTTDPNSAEFKAGAHAALDGRVRIGAEYDTPGWSPEEAERESEMAMDRIGPANIVGVYAANDGLADGAAASIRDSGMPPDTPLTGMDADLEAIHRIMLRTQTMTIYKPIQPEAQNAAQLAVDLGAGRPVRGTSTVSNDTEQAIPAMITKAIVVTRDTIKDTVVRDGFWTVNEVCNPATMKPACAELGIA
ncbi:substrate-binding domain-containing protein [Herbidospora sp. NEAU-GS84]|uniref:Substrate-binding domain-containing protein n=1 Tax=Herbidospora solisilvae TaxID=2696284 RepID=A0A7C9N1I2_9ACTN|nr:substrate-binding domain-containing protein [Herbidospora solisilvae]NAS22989.1 substrate-binding domain-containing protein [Herbidospora solisilvae]